jgi:large conductance mechanosensitive channel
MSDTVCDGDGFLSFINARNIPAISIGSLCGIAIATMSTSLNGDIVVPLLSFVSRKDIKTAHITLKKGDRDTKKDPYCSYNEILEDKNAIVLRYGNFLSTILNLIIQLFIIYGLVRGFCFSTRVIKQIPSAIPIVTEKLQEVKNAIK